MKIYRPIMVDSWHFVLTDFRSANAGFPNESTVPLKSNASSTN